MLNIAYLWIVVQLWIYDNDMLRCLTVISKMKLSWACTMIFLSEHDFFRHSVREIYNF